MKALQKSFHNINFHLISSIKTSRDGEIKFEAVAVDLHLLVIKPEVAMQHEQAAFIAKARVLPGAEAGARRRAEQPRPSVHTKSAQGSFTTQVPCKSAAFQPMGDVDVLVHAVGGTCPL